VSASTGRAVFDFDGQVAVVGGAAGGIGSAIVSLLAELGAVVVALDIDEAAGRAAVKELTTSGLKAEFIAADLTSHAEVVKAVDAVVGRHGKVDVAANAVGWSSSAPFLEEDESYWRRVIDLNLMSTMFLASAVLPSMTKQKYGRLVFVGSGAGLEGRPQRSAYSAAKAGVIGFAKAMCLEYGADGITANVVSPGGTDTALMRTATREQLDKALANIPLGKFASPIDQAWGVAFLASRHAGHITGHTLAIDGGARRT